MSDNARYIIEGSTVRKVDAQPKQPVRTKETPQPKTRPAVQVDRSWIDEAKYAVFLGMSVCIGVAFCIILLKNSVDLRNEKRNVSQLETQLNKQLNANIEYSARLDGAVDIDEIYRIATEELGMVYSEPGQTVYYSKNNEDYAVQYKDVPEANK
jgi:hypothetical protein